MKTLCSLLILACMAVMAIALPVMAQERSVGGQQGTETDWSNLVKQANTANAKARDLNTRMDAVTNCGKRGLVYGPGGTGADAQGCIVPVLPANVVTSLSSLTTNSNAAVNTVNSVLSCNANGQVYYSSTGKCGSIVPPANIVSVKASSQQIAGNGQYAAYATVSCPAGTTLLSCMGATNPDINGSCGTDCGYIGAGPINSNTCMATIDTGGGTHATVWASCIKN